MNRRTFIKSMLGLVTLPVAGIIVGSAKKFETALVKIKPINTFLQGFPPDLLAGNHSITGWEVPSLSNNNKYIHHSYTKENNKFTYYTDGVEIPLTDKRALLV